MDSAGFAPLIVLHILVGLTTASSDLPGLFSGTICSSSFAAVIQPWCSCREKLAIDDNVGSWCGSYTKFSQCVEDSLREQPTPKGDYLHHVFNKTMLDTRMEYLCEDENFPKIIQCEERTGLCQTGFLNSLAENMTEQDACILTESISKCLWKNDDKCPIKINHLLSRFADSFAAGRCTKFSNQTAGDRCVAQRAQLFDKNNFEECLDGVQYQVDCMNRESLHSEHSKDKLYGIGADRMNIYLYETYSCELLEKHRGDSCIHKKVSKETKECYKGLQQGEKNFVVAIENGREVPVDNICSFYQNITACFQKSEPDCQPRADQLVALLCSAFPKSCKCPIRLDKGYADAHFTKNASPPSAPKHLFVFFILTVLAFTLTH